jgi:hypothetical protein
MRHEEPLGRGVDSFVTHKNRRWFYQTGTDVIPILRDELIHFKDWNPWNPTEVFRSHIAVHGRFYFRDNGSLLAMR